MRDYFAVSCKLSDLMNKVDNYYKKLKEIGWTDRMQLSHHYYYGKAGDSSYLRRSGSQKQNTDIMVNDYRSIVQHISTLVTANRPSYDARATNTDHKSQTQAILAEQILDYYLREKKVERLLKKACNYSIKYSEGFIALDWDTSLGNIWSRDEEGNPIYEGDISYRVLNPLQVIRDIEAEDSLDWAVTTQRVNKHELAAKFPEHAEHILSLELDMSKENERAIDYTSRGRGSKCDTDMIDFYVMYHRKSAQVPEGVLCMFVEGKKLLQTPLPYPEIPVYRIAPDNLDGTCLGYTGAWDLLGLQTASDKLYSAVVSNNITFAKQIVQTTSDADVNVSDLADGLILVETDAELKPVNLTKSAPETYNLLDTLQSRKQELSGINEVIRGVPSPNLRSGNSLALIAAQAITYNSGIQQSYNELVEDVGTSTIRFLKEFAESPRFAAIVGKYKKSYMREFQKTDLENFDRVTVEQQGSVMRTTAGKIEIAESLLQNGLVKRPDQYLAVLETGKLDPLIEAEQAEILLIRAENELMANGNMPVVTPLDLHDMHIREHKAVLATPDSRQDPTVVKSTLDHIQEHINLKRSVDPELLMLLGNQPSQMTPQSSAPKAPTDEMAPPEAGEPPMDVPNQPNLPNEADQMSQAAYEQLQDINGGNENV